MFRIRCVEIPFISNQFVFFFSRGIRRNEVHFMSICSHSLTHSATIRWVFCWHYFPIGHQIFDIDWLTSCMLDCRTHRMMDALIKIRIIISLSVWGGNFQFQFSSARCYFSCVFVNISIFVSPYGRWQFNTVVNCVYINIM